jgi:hypothetical protein
VAERPFSVRATEYLTYHRDVLEHALRNEIISAKEDTASSEKFAAELRAGGRHPLFAPGEPGAAGAEGIAANHRRRITSAEKALEELAEVFDGD